MLFLPLFRFRFHRLCRGFCRKLLVAGIEGAILKGDRDVAVLGGNACAVFEGNTLNGGVGIEIGIGPVVDDSYSLSVNADRLVGSIAVSEIPRRQRPPSRVAFFTTGYSAFSS